MPAVPMLKARERSHVPLYGTRETAVQVSDVL